MSPANASSSQREGETVSPRSLGSTPSWLREWNGFSDFKFEGRGLRGPLDEPTNSKNRPDKGAGVRGSNKAIEDHRSAPDSAPASKKDKMFFGQRLAKWIKNGKRVSRKEREKKTFLKLPMDIMLIILEHVDPMDRVMLRFTCKSLYSAIPLDIPFPFPQHSCGKARMFMRLMESSLLPKFYQKTQLLNKNQTKLVLRSFKKLLHCELCQNHWFINSGIQCPFHYPMNTEKGLGFRELINVKAGFKFTMNHLIPSSTVSREDYIYFTERSVAAAPPTAFRTFKFDFVKSWSEQVFKWNDSGLYETPKTQIWTLHCCSHCMFVLPSNSYRNKCSNCNCEMCGWTPVQILRVYGTEDGQPRFVPLGHLREATNKGTLKILRGRRLVEHKPKTSVFS